MFQFLYCGNFLALVINHSFKGHTLVAACLLYWLVPFKISKYGWNRLCQMGAVPVGFQSDGMIWVSVVFQSFPWDSLHIWTFSEKHLSFSLLCAMLRPLLGICNIYICVIVDETGCAMVILLPWCDFPLPDVTFLYRRCDMGMMWQPPRLMWRKKYGATVLRKGVLGGASWSQKLLISCRQIFSHPFAKSSPLSWCGSYINARAMKNMGLSKKLGTSLSRKLVHVQYPIVGILRF